MTHKIKQLHNKLITYQNTHYINITDTSHRNTRHARTHYIKTNYIKHFKYQIDTCHKKLHKKNRSHTNTRIT